ncbi:MAG: hypothetical protein D3924_12400 [Candidatus Electrothrix sp. AR4]|nr:hypothetical protein [Candidatus Electrothrix sp. AR4]
MKEFDTYYSALFSQSNRIYFVRYTLLTITIACLLYSVFARGYYLYTATVSALLFQIISWYLKVKIENIRYIANEFHKFDILYRAYGRIPSEFHLSHLKAMVSGKIFSDVEKKKKNDDVGGESYSENIDSPREKLFSMIHENCYWNHYLYKYVFLFFVAGITLILSGFVVAFFFAFPLIKIDPEYTIPRLAFTFLSLFLVYEILEKAKNSYVSSKIMLEIDNELTRSREDISEVNLLKIFNQYCNIKESAPDIPGFLYKRNKEKLNDGWKSRILKMPDNAI